MNIFRIQDLPNVDTSHYELLLPTILFYQMKVLTSSQVTYYPMDIGRYQILTYPYHSVHLYANFTPGSVAPHPRVRDPFISKTILFNRRQVNLQLYLPFLVCFAFFVRFFRCIAQK